MHKLGYMTAVGALLLALTACSGAGEPEANAGTEQKADQSSTNTSAPAAPATIAPAEPTASSQSDDEAWFLEHSAIRVLDIPDADKISAGWYACQRVEEGHPEVVAVEGADADLNRLIVLDAVTLLCPDQEPAFRAYMEAQPL